MGGRDTGWKLAGLALAWMAGVALQLNEADRVRLDAVAPPWSATLRYYDAALAIDFRPNLARW